MVSAELGIIIEKLKHQGEMAFLEGATEEQIVAFETAHDLHFPSKYKEWLSFSDGGECFVPVGIQLYGVAHLPLIDVEDDDKPGDNYVVIGALPAGDPILCEKEGEQISIYNHDAGRIEEDETYPDFNAFLNNLSEILGIGG